jgi:plasmid stability protein
VDVNVKNLEPEVVERLAQQAAAEGMSQQEWLRQILRRSAARLSPAELLAQRSQVQPMTETEFAALRRRATRRRGRAVERLDASDRRR